MKIYTIIYMADRLGIQFEDETHTKVLNIRTNRYVLVTGKIGKAILARANRARDTGGVDHKYQPVPEFFRTYNAKFLGLWHEYRFQTKNKDMINRDANDLNLNVYDNSIENYARRVVQNLRPNNELVSNEMLIVLFKDQTGRVSNKRTIKLYPDDNPNIRLPNLEQHIIRQINHNYYHGNFGGSDGVNETDVPVTNNFIYIWKTPPPIGNANNHYKALDCKLFKGKGIENKGEESKDGNNCFFLIVRQFLNLSEYCNTIRQKLGIEKNVGVDVDQMSMMEDFFKIDIDVYNGESEPEVVETIDDPEKNIFTRVTKTKYHFWYKSENKYKKKLNLYLSPIEEHYYLITEFREIKYCPSTGVDLCDLGKKKLNNVEKKKILKKQDRLKKDDKKIISEKRDLKRKLLFYDLETVFDITKQSMLVPYSISYIEIEEHELKNYLIEPEKYYHRVINHIGDNCINKFMRFILDCDLNYHYTIIGYNSSKFDNFLLLDYCLENEIRVNKNPIINNSVLTLTIEDRHNVFDLYRFVMKSLKSACDDYKTVPRKEEGFKHETIQRIYNQNIDRFYPNIKDKMEKIKSYNNIDVLSMVSLFAKVQLNMLEATGKNILDYCTIASLAYDFVSETSEFRDYVKPAKTYDDDMFFRKSLNGGRCEEKESNLFIKSDGQHRMIDCGSQYPYVMINRAYPIGDYKETKKYIKNKLGIYSCVIKHKDNVKNVVPYREKDNELNWKTKEQFNQILTSIDIDCLRKYHGKDSVTILSGIYWHSSSDKIFSVLKKIELLKIQQDEFKKNKDDVNYNPALRETYKLILNSVSGKVAQRNYTDISEYINNIEKLREFNKKCVTSDIYVSIYKSEKFIYAVGKCSEKQAFDKNKKPKPSFLASFIYSYSREHMYKNVLSKCDVLYTDTDSALISLEDYDKLPKEIMGDAFGQFKEELGDKNRDIHIISRKFYHIDNQIEDKIKMKIKGVNKNDIIIPNELLEKFQKMNLNELFDSYYSDKYRHAYSIESFKDIIQKKDVYVLCSQLKKEIGKDVHIKQIFMIKKLNDCNFNVETHND